MFQKDSIKFKLIFVISVMIIGMMILLIVLQLHNTNTLKSAVNKSSTTYIEEYGKSIQETHLEMYMQDLDFYIDTIVNIIAQDLYNLDTKSIAKHARKFIRHKGICTISVVDTLSLTEVVRIDKGIDKGNNDTCKTKTLDLIYKQEKIGVLNLSYTLQPVRDTMRRNRELIGHNTTLLQQELERTILSNITVQLVLSFLVTLLLLLLVAKQINKSIVVPIYKLLEEMRMLNEDEVLKISKRQYDKGEISKLSKYFHKHTAKLINRLNKRANYDDLTRLLSRQRLIYDLSAHNTYAIAIVDIDRFKEINNYLGTKSGDRVLKSTANLLSHFFARLSYQIYRVNGDEFAILCTDKTMTDPHVFHKHIEDFLMEFDQKELSFGDENLAVSMCSGIADSRAKNPMVAATTALKYAKLTKQKMVIFDESLPIIKEYGNNLKIAKVIKHAIAHDLVLPYFQPIVCMHTKKIVKYEALMRIQDDKDKVYTPFEFLDIAKHTGAYGALSKSMIKKSIASISPTPYDVTINLSTKDIESDNIYTLMEELEITYAIMHRVVFEITEQEGITDFETVQEFTQKAKMLGAKIAIDDFGSGYSNFENIIRLNVDFLKIDGSLIRNILEDKSAEIVVETIIDFAQKLDIKTVAEFVSSEQIYEKMEHMGIDYVQGYFLGKPEATLREGAA